MDKHKKVVNLNRLNEDLSKLVEQIEEDYFSVKCEINNSRGDIKVVFNGYISGYGHSRDCENPEGVITYFDREINPDKYEDKYDTEIEVGIDENKTEEE